MPVLPASIPAVAEARWRPLSMADIPAFVRLMEAARVADGEEEVITEEVARHEFEDPHVPLATNSLALADPDGTLQAAVLVQERVGGEGARRVFISGRTHPAVRGQGIGSAAFGWGSARADEILRAQPAHVPRFAETWVDVSRTDAMALYEAHGFAPVRWYLEMRRFLAADLPDPVETGPIRLTRYPEGAGEDAAERIRSAHNEAFADHWGSEPIAAEDWARNFIGDPFFRPDLSLVALDGDEIVAYSINYVAESDWPATGVQEGWVGQLGVRRAWRRRGLATALLVRSMELFRAAGLEAATLGVDDANPSGAVAIYERVGFRPIRRSARFRRSLGAADADLT